MNKNNTFVILAIVILIVIIGVLVSKGTWKKESRPQPIEQLDTMTQNDTTVSIEKDLNSMDTNTKVDTDLKDIDNAINAL